MLQRWCVAYRSLILRLFLLTAGFSSISGLLVVFLPPRDLWPWWYTLLLLIALILFITLVFFEFNDHKTRHVFNKADSTGIENYMYDWIKYGGRVAIWTRDMTWANSARITGLLTTKALNHELILCMPSPIELSTKLVDDGAEAYYYGPNQFDVPISRFTIVDFGHDGSSVAVGRTVGRTHVIDEFSARDHPVYHIAADLVALVRANPAKETPTT